MEKKKKEEVFNTDPTKIHAYSETGKAICGAIKFKKRNEKGPICKRVAGWGTDHVGTGRCKYHEREKLEEKIKIDNHGAYKTIYFDQLTDKEKLYITKKKHDAETQIDWELMFLDIRISRMLERIDQLYEQQMVMVSKKIKSSIHIPEEDDEDQTSGMKPMEIEEKMENIGKHIAKWEEIITNMQRAKQALLTLKVKLIEIEAESEEEEDNFAGLTNIISDSMKIITLTRKQFPVDDTGVEALDKIKAAKLTKNKKFIENTLEKIQKKEKEE